MRGSELVNASAYDDRTGPSRATKKTRLVSNRSDFSGITEARKRHGKMIGVDWAILKSQIEAAQARFGPEAASITFT